VEEVEDASKDADLDVVVKEGSVMTIGLHSPIFGKGILEVVDQIF